MESLSDNIEFKIVKYISIDNNKAYRQVLWTKKIGKEKYGDYILLDIEKNHLEALIEVYDILMEQARLVEERIKSGVV